MIRTLTIAAAAAAVGYAIGQRDSENPESRFERDQPTESGVGRPIKGSEIEQPYNKPLDSDVLDGDEVIGQ